MACPYCGTTHMIAAPRIEIPQGPSDYEKRKVTSAAAWDRARATSQDPGVALRAVIAVVAVAAKDEQEAERGARLAEQAIRSFDAEHGTQIILDKVAIHRVAEAAIKAVIELRETATTELNLPFLTATSQGPLHLQQQVTHDTLAKLDQGVEVQVVEPPPAAEPTPEPPKKKRKWWQFGS